MKTLLPLSAALLLQLAAAGCQESNCFPEGSDRAGAASRPSSRPASRPAGGPDVSRTGTAAPPDHGPWDAILRENVRDGLVDYLVIRRDHLGPLDRYLDALAAADLAALGRDERLAAYLNLYNATMVRAVVDRLRAGWSPSERDYAVFKEDLARLSSGTVSLDHLEHGIIRKTFDEPRIHVALVCAAVSCPPLIPRAYLARDLDRTLERRMRAFVNDPVRNPIDVEARRLRLSSIFDWYAEDFGGRERVAAYVDRYHEADVSGWPVSFVEYSWKLNIAPPSSGEWVTVTAEGGAALERDGGGGPARVGRGEILAVGRREAGRVLVDPGPGGEPGWVPAGSVAPYRP